MRTASLRFPAAASVAVIAAALVAGCAYPPPTPVDDNFGKAVTGARAQQVVNPDAPTRARAPAGADGQAARSSIDRYQKSFEAPPAPVNVLNIGVGSSAQP